MGVGKMEEECPRLRGHPGNFTEEGTLKQRPCDYWLFLESETSGNRTRPLALVFASSVPFALPTRSAPFVSVPMGVSRNASDKKILGP